MLLLVMRLKSRSTSSFQNKFGAHDDHAKSSINGFACNAAIRLNPTLHLAQRGTEIRRKKTTTD